MTELDPVAEQAADEEYQRYRPLLFPNTAGPEPEDAEYEQYQARLGLNRNQAQKGA